MFHYFFRQLGHESDSIDLAQELFVRVFRAREQYRPQAAFSTWIYTIAHRLLLNRKRWHARHPEIPFVETSEESAGNHFSPRPDPSEVVTRREEWEAVR